MEQPSGQGGQLLIPETQQVFSVISWFLVISLLQLALYPTLKKSFDRYAYPTAFGASLLLFTILSWYCGLVRLPIHLALIPFAGLLIRNLMKGHYTLCDLKEQWRWELVFAIFFFLMLEVRFVNPTISYAEKFMDHAFLASVIRAPVVPPIDPWFGGGFLNVYYYLGYWMFGCLAIVSDVPSSVAFNLALPTVLGVSAVTLYAIGDLLLNRFKWLPLVSLILPNPAFFWQVFQGTPVAQALWDIGSGSTRTITGTINEYPLFSFTWGDVHAHVIGIFNQIFLLFLLAYAYKRWGSLSAMGRWVICILAAVSLGSMPLFNTWDVLIYAPIVVFFGVIILWQNRSSLAWSESLPFLLVIPPLAIACYLPFYLQLKTSTGGIALVTTPSEPAQFFLVHGFFIVLLLVLLARDVVKRPYLLLVTVPFILAGYAAAAIAVAPLVFLIARKPKEIPPIFAILGLILITITELVYLQDNMGETYFRMNTVFKCYIAAWLLLSAGSLAMAGESLARWGRIPETTPRQKIAGIVAVTIILAAIPALVPFYIQYGSPSLDGLAYLDTAHPGDAAAVAYLLGLPRSQEIRIVEAEGGDYSYYSRISSFSGIQGIVGQPFHEYMWRGDTPEGWYSGRLSDIRSIYERPDRTLALMEKYNVTYLVVGEPEREKYNVSLPASGLDREFSQEGTSVYRRSA